MLEEVADVMEDVPLVDVIQVGEPRGEGGQAQDGGDNQDRQP
jgi:hypothetical protein